MSDHNQKLTEFLKARLDEDERIARAATPGSWTPERKGILDSEGIEFVEAPRRDVSHIARHDPARVLAEIAAKRAVINMVPLSQEQAEERFAGFFVEEGAGWEKAQEYVLKHLAAVYANHPDYRQEWADE